MNATQATVMSLADAGAGDKERAARAALRELIERRNQIAGELAECDRAITLSRSRSLEIEDEVEALERKRSRPDMALASASGLVGAILDGREMAVGAAAASERERRLAAEAEALRSARDRLTRELLPSLRERLQFAEHKVADAAANVVTASAAVARLMDGLQELAEEVLRRKSGLNFALGLMAKRSAEWGRVSSFVYDVKPPSVLLDENPERAKWIAALKALETDPEAKLPGDEEAS